MEKKHICVLTATRADYGYLYLVIKKIIKSKKLKLSLLVTGMHLLEEFGKTIEIIKEDGIPIARIVDMYNESDKSASSLGIAIGKAIINLTQVLDELKPDILLVLGDRFEVLAATIAASSLSIPIAHIHGGDNVLYGQIDEQIRHAITKFAHIHFPATQKSGKRIELLGEEQWRIHTIGSPSIDSIMHEKLLQKKEICEKLGLDPSRKIVVCILHPYIPEADKAGEHMRITLQVLKELNSQIVINYPNNDPGSDLIIKEIKNIKKFSNFKIFKNLKYTDYLSLLKNANLLIGNSSSGIIESPIFKIPVINIGDRNRGRETAENVINVPYDYKKIKMAINRAFSKQFIELCQKVINPYGEGNSSDKIVKIFEELKLNKKILIKHLTYEV